MDISNLITLLSGAAFFLFGMSLMGDGLKRIAGNRLEVLLYQLTNTLWKGLLLGTGVTVVIQSSSATSVMTVGFVNSGMMKVRQAIGIILGAILGTSITGWIICLSDLGGGGDWTSLFSITTLTGIFALVGIILRMFCKSPGKIHAGDILLGFAVLMFGMSTMSGAVEPLKESAGFIKLLTLFSNPALGVLVGILFACILQSASAAVGILQALAVTGAIDFAAALPLIMGIAIGAAVPVLLSAIGATTDGKRTAFVYLFITVIGVAVCSALYYSYDFFVGFPYRDVTMTTFSIAFVNTAFRLLNVLLICPFAGLLEKTVNRIIKEKPGEEEKPAGVIQPEERFLPSPFVAISQCRQFINEMARNVQSGFTHAVNALAEYSESEYRKAAQAEARSDQYEDSIGTYLMKIMRSELSPVENTEISKFLYTLSDFERISDHALNIAKLARELHEKGSTFSGQAKKELSIMQSAVSEMLAITMEAFITDDLKLAEKVEPLETVIDELRDELQFSHVKRLKKGQCELEQSFAFNDLLTNYERISDHCSNIAVAILELESEEFNTHEYSKNVKQQPSSYFAETVEEFQEKYSLATCVK